GVHSLMSGTAAADFGGRKATATASGIVDGFVYLGSGVQSVGVGYLVTHYSWQWCRFSSCRSLSSAGWAAGASGTDFPPRRVVSFGPVRDNIWLSRQQMETPNT